MRSLGSARSKASATFGECPGECTFVEAEATAAV